MFLEKKKYSKKFYFLSGVGSGLILFLAILITWTLWQKGVEQAIFTNHFATSVLFTDSLTSAGSAAPWALISINWLACKSSIKGLRKYLAKKLG